VAPHLTETSDTGQANAIVDFTATLKLVLGE